MQKPGIPHDALILVSDGERAVFFRNKGTVVRPQLVVQHLLAEDRLAADIADTLYRSAHANEFQRLIIVAPPKVLGTLRKTLHKEVVERIEAEVPKELATRSVPSIQNELASWG